MNKPMKIAPAIQTTASWMGREHELTDEDGNTHLVIILSEDNYYLPNVMQSQFAIFSDGSRLTNPEDFKIECYHPSTCPVHRV